MTIPASQFVNVIGNVLSAGGNGLDLIGLGLTQNTRVPIPKLGSTLSFATQPAVSSYFGATSAEAAFAAVYFKAHDTKTQTPGALLFAQYPSDNVPAYIRGAAINGQTVAQLQALSGSLTLTIDSVARTASSINLSSATSYSSIAALIQTGLNASEVTEASVTGTIAAETVSFTGSIAGNVLTVTAVSSGTLVPGTLIASPATIVSQQLSGTTGGAGVYIVQTAANVVSVAMTGAYGLFTVSAVTSGTLSIGQALTGTSVTAGTEIYGLGTGAGLTGTYYVSPSQAVSSETITATSEPVSVSFDSVSGGLVITSGEIGANSTITYATGTLSAALSLTQATGAVLSQGQNATTPSAFMSALVNFNTDWATFTHLFDPDGGNGNAQKLLFSAWNNGQNNNYAYVVEDSDITPTLGLSTTCLGYQIGPNANYYSGTAPIYDPAAYTSATNNYAAFAMGFAAALNFTQLNGRTTLAYRTQSGLAATVTDVTTATNLAGSPMVLGSWGNGYNYYGAIATANSNFIEFQRGTISGPYQWFDSYINQIWMNNEFQLALMTLESQVNSIPFNLDGYGLTESALGDTIAQALNFGAIRTGITLSSTQSAVVNNAAGKNVTQTLFNQGWYLQIIDPGAQVRGNRGSPNMNFWFTDGESVQAISLTSTLIQ